MKRILLFLAVLLALPGVASAETYYVTQDGGNSPQDGSTYEKAMSVSDHNSGSFEPGDIIYLKGDITKVEPPSSGSASADIIYDGYEAGSYDAINRNPSPSNIATLSGTNYAMLIANKDYITVQDIEFDGNNGAVTEGLVIRGSSSDPATHITVKDCYFHHQQNRGFWTIYETSGTDGACRYIVVGGSPGDGNEFYNIGDNTGGYDVKMSYAHDWVVSYNKMWADPTNNRWGISGVSWGNTRANTQRGLIEYNYVASHNSYIHGEDGIGGKGGQDIIIRYNVVTGHLSKGMGLSAWGDANRIYMYGNYVSDNVYGVIVASGSGERYNDNGVDTENIYIWGNVIASTAVDEYGYDMSGAGISIGGWEGGDCHNNVYVYNNVIANTAPSPTGGYDTGVKVRRCCNDIYVRNNIFYNNRPDESDREQISIAGSLTGETTIENNIFYHSDGTAKIDWGGSNLNADSSSIGSNNIISNPRFSDSSDDVYTLLENSPSRDAGADLSGEVGRATIMGQEIIMNWEDVLDPVTDFTAFPPDVHLADQNDHGSGWERGAYVYTGDGPQNTCSSLGGSCCISPQTCPGTSLGTYPDCSGTCCSEDCQEPPQDTCLDRGFHCCDSCEPGTEHPEDDADCSGVCCGTCLGSDYEYAILKTSTPPTIDGDISEFNNADEINVLEQSTGTTGTYRLMWDEEALYITAEFSDSALNADPTHTDDDELWKDDSLEIMFDTDNDGGDTSPHIDDYKFYAIPSGAYADSQRYDMSWDSGLSHDVSVQGTVNQNTDTDTGWVVEMAIPWPEWGITEPVFGSVWGMNIQLNDMTATGKSSTQWSESGLSVNIPDGWNDVLFTVRADTTRDGCIYMNELVPFIDSWKYDSTTYPMREMMEAVSLYYNPGVWC